MLDRLKYYMHCRRGTLAEYYRKMGVAMGENCEILGRIDLGSEPYLVSLGNRVKITEGVRFITHDGGMFVLRNLYPDTLGKVDLFGKITVGNNVFFGNGAMILPGVTIGDNVVIGAGAVVTRDIPSHSVAAGVPCRVLRGLDAYREKAEAAGIMTKGMSREEKRAYLMKEYGRDEP